MASSALHPDLPADLVATLTREGCRDADHVGLFLSHLGVQANPHRPIRLPAPLLLGLAAALRLFVWERTGVRPFLPPDLPPAMPALRDLLAAAAERSDRLGPLAAALSGRVLRVLVDRLAWHGREALGGEVVLGEGDEDALLDALADLLWRKRHALDTTEGPNR